jgi:hypothetical protein
MVTIGTGDLYGIAFNESKGAMNIAWNVSSANCGSHPNPYLKKKQTNK